MVNDETAPTGRPAGALGWAGLANCFFWIDRRNGIGGYWATQILPMQFPLPAIWISKPRPMRLLNCLLPLDREPRSAQPVCSGPAPAE
jgi:hypothetical protein